MQRIASATSSSPGISSKPRTLQAGGTMASFPSNRYFKAHLYYFELETLAACASTHFEPVNSSETANLQMLFRRRDHTQPIRMPTPEFAASAKARALCLGWWSYLTTGKGHRALHRKIRRCHEERGIKHLSGRAILNLFSSPTKVAGPF